MNKLFNSLFANPDFASKPQTNLRLPNNNSGRSMIEMLGVLAIIAVLTVGGIAGYSKAMTQFKVNKIIAETNQLIAAAHEYASKDKSFIIPGALEQRKALGLCPDSWEDCADSGLGGIVSMATNSIVFKPKVPEMCLAAVNNIAIPLKESVETVHISSQGPENEDEDEDATYKCMNKAVEEMKKCFDMSDHDERAKCMDKAEKSMDKCSDAANGMYDLEIKHNYIGDDGDKYDESSKKGTLDFNDQRLISAVASICRGEDRFVQITFKEGIIGN